MNVDSTCKIAFVGGPDVDQRIDLMRFLKNEYDVLGVGSWSGLREKFHDSGFHYRSYSLARGVNPFADIRTFFQLYMIFRQERPDIVHTFDTKPCIFGRIAATLAGVPVVVGTLPGLGSLYVDNVSKARRVIRAVYEQLQSVACRLSDLTIFQNRDDERELVARDVVPCIKTMVVPGSGVRTDVFDPAVVPDAKRVLLREELGIPSDVILVTMVSRLVRSKGIFEFLAAARIARSRNNSVKFLLVGEVDEGSMDRLTADELSKLKQTVVVAGHRDDIPTVLAASDILVLPSFYREGIPRVLLEGASMCLPIITADSPGCREVVEHGINGFLVKPRDSSELAEAMLLLIDDSKMRERFGQESRRHAVKRFDISKIADQTRMIYRQVLTQKAASAPLTR